MKIKYPSISKSGKRSSLIALKDLFSNNNFPIESSCKLGWILIRPSNRRQQPKKRALEKKTTHQIKVQKIESKKTCPESSH